VKRARADGWGPSHVPDVTAGGGGGGGGGNNSAGGHGGSVSGVVIASSGSNSNNGFYECNGDEVSLNGNSLYSYSYVQNDVIDDPPVTARSWSLY
jgi:hypothetical protein